MALVAATTARLVTVGAVAACLAWVGVAAAQPARADSVGYLVDVTVRPGYNFANADAALSYGSVCATRSAPA